MEKKPITKRIKTLKDILKIAKPNAGELRLINYKGKAKRLLGARALLLAEMIAEVYNEGTKLNWKDYNQEKWFGWYNMDGSSFCSSSYDTWSTRSYASSRLHFKEESLFWDAVNKFPKIYKTLMIK